MAWQEPKTNWAAPDGVRYGDLNRIEGNILELRNTGGVHADRVVYVDADAGSDAAGTGGAHAPYATINKALSTIPRNLNGKSVIVSIAGGVYAENVTISGFDAPITLTNGGETVVVNGFRVDGCHCSLSNSIEIMSHSAIFIVNCGTITGTGRLSVDGSHIAVNYNSSLALDVVTCENSPGFAIAVDRCSRFHADMIQGEGNSYGISSQGGSIVTFGENYLETGSPEYFTAMGGRIYNSAQTSILNY